MEEYLKKYHSIFFGGLALLLLYPTFNRGYVFFLDWMVEPNIAFSDINFQADSIVRILLKLLAVIFSFGVMQRIFLFATLYFLGIAGFRLVKKTGNVFSAYFAGIFLIFNPFTYARLVEQPTVVFGSMLFFWFWIFLVDYLEENNWRKLAWASLLAGLAVSILNASLFFIAAVSASLLAFYCWKTKKWKLALQTFAIIFLAIIILNSNWIFSFDSSDNQGVGGIRNFTSMDWETFRTRAIGGDSVYFTVLALQGYWGEYQDRFISIRENPLWETSFLAILFLVALGLIWQLKNRDYFAKSLVLVAIVAYALAIGIASPIFSPLTRFLFDHFPLYAGFRESQKWTVILVLAYAYFGAWGIKHMLEMKKLQNYRTEIGIFCAILPMVFSFSMIRGAHEHLVPHEFPVEWQEAKDFISRGDRGKILFFPWHLYAELDFAGKNVAVPARAYFGKNVIQGNNLEFGAVYSHALDEETRTIEKYVARKDNPEQKINFGNFSADMKKMGIKTIVLAKTEDWQKYLWLDRIEGATKVMENKELIIYRLQ